MNVKDKEVEIIVTPKQHAQILQEVIHVNVMMVMKEMVLCVMVYFRLICFIL